MIAADIQAAKELLLEHGYVVLKAKSYRAAQNRQGIAQIAVEWAQLEAESAKRWARDCLTEERRIRERLTFVWGVAQAHGATVEELGGSSLPVRVDTGRTLSP